MIGRRSAVQIAAVPTPSAVIEQLSRAEVLTLVHEYMMTGHLIDRALMPQVFLHGRDFADVDQIAIDEWMGVSPLYTARMRDLMNIEGDDVVAMMKALQLDVGFVHQYMNVAYKVIDERHAEFWLNHCGALMDAEPHGEDRVIGMCHHIEDPTFDATAFATNGRAQIRPVHRPPRTPTDRAPHCHWTIDIDPNRAPVTESDVTQRARSLGLLDVPIVCATERLGDGLVDYSGEFSSDFSLGMLATDTLVAVAREFQMQVFLLTASAELAVAARYGEAAGRSIGLQQWIGAGWVASERIGRALDLRGGGIDVVAALLALHPALPPGFTREVAIDGNQATAVFTPEIACLLDADEPGWAGQFARCATTGIAAMLHALEPKAAVVSMVNDGSTVTVVVDVDDDREAVVASDAVALSKLSTATAWKFSI